MRGVNYVICAAGTSCQVNRSSARFSINIFFLVTLMFVTALLPCMAHAGVAANYGADVYGYERKGVYNDGPSILFRGALAAFKGKDFEDARRVWEFSARMGDPASQYMLGHIYRNGWGVEPSIKSAYGWYVAAATQNVAAAQFRLGLAFFRVGDIKNTLQWWHKAANSGYTAAQYNIGLIHLYGTGVEKNTDIAQVWLTKAANHGSAHAQFYIGVMYLKGDGVAANRDVARTWFTRSQGNGFDYAGTNIEEIQSGVVMPIFAQ